MSKTTPQTDSTTPSSSNVLYEKKQAVPAQADGLDRRLNCSRAPEENAGDYVRAYRTGGDNVAVSYNSAEIHARAVRREICKMLGS